MKGDIITNVSFLNINQNNRVFITILRKRIKVQQKYTEQKC